MKTSKIINDQKITEIERSIIDAFHNLWEHKYGHHNRISIDKVKFMGNIVCKFPTDLWVYQEIIFDTRPEFIIETGTKYGGSAYFFAKMLDLFNIDGKVITIDNNNERDYFNYSDYVKPHDKIEYIISNSTDIKLIEELKTKTKDSKSTLVILDSFHGAQHVLNEMCLYGQFVTKNNYMIVEDGYFGKHPIDTDDHGLFDSPYESVETFINSELGDNWVIDHEKEKFLFTTNPYGYLKKIK